MFKFNKDSLRIEYITLLALSKATIDPRIQFKDAGGVIHKMSIPVSVARIVRARLKGVGRFPNGYPAALAFVEGRIVAMDVAVGKSYKMFKDFDEWITCLETRSSVLDGLEGDWLWDGQYAYREVGEIKQMGDSNFGSIDTRVFNLYRLGEARGDMVEDLVALCFKNPETGEWTKTTPMTRHSGAFLQITGDVDKFNKHDHFIEEDEFKKIDSNVFANLRFVTYAARVLARQFGYTAVEPLGLPILMMEHQTFNVGGLPTEMQAASPAPMAFSSALAWMIGLNRKVGNLEDLIAIKSSTKMLLTKGNTRKSEPVKQKENEAPAPVVSTRDLIAQLRVASAQMQLVTYEPTELD